MKKLFIFLLLFVVFFSSNIFSVFAKYNNNSNFIPSLVYPRQYIDNGVYGSGISADTVANTHVGGPIYTIKGTQVSFKFTAEENGILIRFLEWWKSDLNGYGGGNGGRIKISLQSDDGNGFPSGTVLTSEIIIHPATGIQQYSFSHPVKLVKGEIYHLVHTNIDSKPDINFISLNSLYCYGEPLSPLNAHFSDSEYSQLVQHGIDPWEIQRNYTPILQLIYSNGFTQGMGYIETEITDYSTVNGNTQMSEESFTPSGISKIVSSVSVRLRRSKGIGDLAIRLETSKGILIEEVKIPAASVPISLPGNDDGGAVWVTAKFLSSHILTRGTSYNLRLSTDKNTIFTLFSLRKAPGYGFSNNTYFKDGSSLKTIDGKNWFPDGRRSDNPRQCDLQFYFNIPVVKMPPTKNIVSFSPEQSSKNFLDYISDESIDIIEMKEGVYHLPYTVIDVDRKNPILIRPALGAKVVLSGRDNGTTSQFWFGLNKPAGNITMQGFIFEEFVLGQQGIIHTGNCHNITLNDMLVRNCTSDCTVAQPYHSWALYMDTIQGFSATNFTANRWTVEASACQMSALQVYGGKNITANDWVVDNVYLAIYASSDRGILSNLMLDNWVINNSGGKGWGQSCLSVVFQQCSGIFSNIRAVSSGFLFNQETPSLTDGGGNSIP